MLKRWTGSIGIGPKIAVIPLIAVLALLFVMGVDQYLFARIEGTNANAERGFAIALELTRKLGLETNFLATEQERNISEIDALSLTVKDMLRQSREGRLSAGMEEVLKGVETVLARHDEVFSEAAEVVRSISSAKRRLSALYHMNNVLMQEMADAIALQITTHVTTEGGYAKGPARREFRNALNEFKGLTASAMLSMNDLLSSSDEDRFLKTDSEYQSKLALVSKVCESLSFVTGIPDDVSNWKLIAGRQAEIGGLRDELYRLWGDRQVLVQKLAMTHQGVQGSAMSIVYQAKREIDSIKRVQGWTGFAAIVLTVAAVTLLSVLVIGSITRPLRRVAEAMAGFSRGRHKVFSPSVDGRGDEIGRLEEAFGRMVDKSNEVVEMARGIAAGNYDIRVRPSSGQDELSLSLMAMTEALRNYKVEIENRSKQLERLVFERTKELEHEISERADTREDLRLSEEKFSKAFRSSPDWVTISTLREGRYVDVNEAFLAITGYSRNEVIGRTSRELGTWAEPEKRDEMVRELQANGMIRNQEVKVGTKNGEVRIMLRSAEVIELRGETCLITINLDITERKLLEEQLRQAQKMEAVGQLAGGVAHDFNNILTAIMGYAGILRMKTEDDHALAPIVSQILKATERASALTGSLLAFSRKQAVSTKATRVNDILSNVERFLERLIGEEIEFVCAPGPEGLTIMADVAQIEQMLVNLATNAKDSMPDGGTLLIRARQAELDDEYVRAHGYGSPGRYALLEVSDTGDGIDEATREKIFEPFFTTKDVGKGTGLGLALVYGTIKQHGGYINVNSEVGQGTTFSVYLPLVAAEAESVEAEESALPPGGTETVLLAEDDETLRGLARTVLEEFGYTVILAVDGEDAVNKFAENSQKVQLLILDVVMPRMNGREVYNEIGRRHGGVKTLFISGYTGDILTDKGVINEGLNFIAKPVPPTELLRKVRDILDS